MITGASYGHGGDIYRNRVRLDFSVNVNPLGTPGKVKEAVIAAAERLDTYPDPSCEKLRVKTAFRFGADPEDILFGNGAAELIYQFVSALRPKNALLLVPSFSEYEKALASSGCEISFYTLLRENGFAADDNILPLITEKTDLVMLCSPNNPTGRVMERELLRRILERCRKTGTWLFLDECFIELSDTETPSLYTALQPGDRVFILRAFTKTYAMAGLRLGFALCREKALLSEICRNSQPWNISVPAQEAGIAALDCGEWVREARKVIRQEKEYLAGSLRKFGMTVYRSDANFLLFSAGHGLYEALLQRGILIRNCENYRGLSAGDFRIAVLRHEENEMLINAIEEVLHA